MAITAGIDLGTGAVKTVIFRIDGDDIEWLAKRTDRIRNRDPLQLARRAFDELLAEQGMSEDDLDYIATTGDGENVTFIRLDYDFEAAAAAIREVPDLPNYLADRLHVGR